MVHVQNLQELGGGGGGGGVHLLEGSAIIVAFCLGHGNTYRDCNQ